MKKHLLSQVHQLKSTEPDKQWKTDSQEFLRAHINDDVKTGAFFKVMVWVKDFAKVSSQPAFALAAFVLILITGVAFFNPILSNAKPDGSLYIARIISEKAQLNMTFNKENRDKLSAQFATNHAKDITNLMNDPQFHEEEGSEDKIANLSDDFNKEINSARESINSINEREKNTYTNNSNNNNKTNVNNNSDDSSDLGSENLGVNNNNSDDEGTIFSADTRKDDQGLEINVKDDEEGDSSSDNSDNNIEPSDEANTAEIDTATSTEESTATSTDESAESVESSEDNTRTEEENASSTLNQLQSITDEVNKEGGDVNEIIKALDDAERLFNEKRYPEALEKLDEVEKSLEGVSSEISDEPSVE
jgi:hypothetical protein